MSRIVSYKYDLDINDGDAWVGTDASSLTTRQYTAAALANYLNIKGKVSVAGQMLFKYVFRELAGPGTFSLPGGGQQNVSFASITSLTISKYDLIGANVVAYIEYLIGTSILVSSQGDVGNFGHYKVTGYTQNTTNIDYYNLQLQYIGHSGTLLIDKLYFINDFNLPGQGGGGDKNFTFIQSAPSTTWTIAHPLDKYVSVSVTNFNGFVIQGEIDYISTDEVVVTFTQPVAGRAFLN